MTSKSSHLKRLLSRAKMLFALLGISAFFSAATLTSRIPESVDAAPHLIAALSKQASTENPILIVLSRSPEDRELGAVLQDIASARGILVHSTFIGEPPDLRSLLAQLDASGKRIRAFACSRTTSSWRILADAHSDFPKIGTPPVITAPAVRQSDFLKPSNLVNIANQIAVIAIVAIGMTMVVIAGGIDLSVGSLIALSAVVATRLIRDFGGAVDASPIAMCVCSLAGIVATGAFGALTGTVITKAHVPPFIASLSAMLVASGLAFILADGQSIHQIPERFVALGRDANFLHIPHAVLLVASLYLVSHIVMTRRRFGRYLYAVGGNTEAARLAGVPVSQVTLRAYALSGLLSGLGGVLMASQLKSGSPTYGSMYELYVIAAVVVGGTSLRGGEGSIVGTLVGTLTIAVIQNGMNLLNVESYTQKVILGLVILGAVLVDSRGRSRP
jgi:ribose transport system permease protein